MERLMTTEGLQLFVFCGVLLISIFTMFGVYKKIKKKKADRFEERATLSDEDFFNTFYKDSGISKSVIKEIIKDIATATEIPIGKLRPTDRFDHELAPVKGWEFGDGLIELNWRVMERIEERTKKERIPSLNTVDDYIRYVDRLKSAE